MYRLLVVIGLLWWLAPVFAQGMLPLLTLTTGASPLDAVAFSPDGLLLASGGRDHLIRLWNVQTGDMLRKIPGHNDRVMSLAFSPDGILLASGSRDGHVMLWRTDTFQRLSNLSLHTDEVTGLVFTPDSTLLISASRDATIQFYDTAAETVVATLGNYSGAVWEIALSPDGSMLASAGEDGTVWLWGIQPGHSWLKRLAGHEAPVATVAFAPDGQRLVSGGLDGTLRLWDLNTSAVDLEPVLTLRGHLAPIMGAAFSADETVVISASLDGTVRLWDTGNAQNKDSELAVLRMDGTPLTTLSVNPLHILAAVAGTNGMVSLWDTSAETLADLKTQHQSPAAVQNNLPPAAAISDTLPEPLTGRTLYIPSIQLKTEVTSFAIGSETWVIDPWEKLAGHLQGTAWITDTGNIVIGGHSEYPDGRPGIFRWLYNVGPGDEIFLSDEGIQRRYVVVNILHVNYTDLSVVYPTPFNRLTLITCDIPSYVAEQNLYYERLVVIADEIAP